MDHPNADDALVVSETDLVVDAIYDQGVFRPVTPIDLAPGTRLRLRVPTGSIHGPVSGSVGTLAAPATPGRPYWLGALMQVRSAAITSRTEIWLFGFGLLIYGLTRFWDLVKFPIYFFCDEAIQAVLAEGLLQRGLRDEAGQFLPAYLLNAGQWNPGLAVYVHMLPLSLLGKAEWVTRGTSALVSMLAVVAVSMTLRLVFEQRFWWAGALVMSLIPAWFLHSRTAFETVMMASFYACFLCLYLLYRYRSPRFLPAAVVLGGMTFYSYSSGPGLMLVSGVLLFFSDLRYHLRHWRVALLGAALCLVVAVPLLRFYLAQPEALANPLQVRLSYWVEPISLGEKLRIFGRNYVQGLSPAYWFVPNSLDLERHRMKGMGNIRLEFLPLAAIGLWVCLRNWRSSAHRAILIALLATPFAAATVGILVTRVLVFVVPAALLICFGLEQVYVWLQRRVAYLPVAVAICVLFSAMSLGMLRTALIAGPTWYTDYTLSGMQYGAPQLFDVIPRILETAPETQVILSPTWANNPNVYAPYYLPPALQPRLLFGNVDAYMNTRIALDRNSLFIMTPDEHNRAQASGKFIMQPPERIVPYPDGRPGFYFVRMEYVVAIDEMLAADKQARAQLISEQFLLDGQAVEVRHSLFDGGQPADLFDSNPRTLVRGMEANPLVIEIHFAAPRSVAQLGMDFGTMALFEVKVVYTGVDGAGQEFVQRYENLPSDPHVDIDLPGGAQILQRLRIEVTDAYAGEPAHVHVRGLNMR